MSALEHTDNLDGKEYNSDSNHSSQEEIVPNQYLSADRGGVSFTLEARIFPRIWIVYSRDARALGNNSLSLADTYKISAARTYDSKKYEASVTVNTVNSRSAGSFETKEAEYNFTELKPEMRYYHL